MSTPDSVIEALVDRLMEACSEHGEALTRRHIASERDDSDQYKLIAASEKQAWARKQALREALLIVLGVPNTEVPF